MLKFMKYVIPIKINTGDDNMKNKLLAFLLILLFVAEGNAGLKERLEPILSGDLNIAVDTFIIGTQDKYVASIIRDIDDDIVKDLTMTLADVLNSYDRNTLALIEKRAFDKNSKKISLVERKLALSSDLQTSLASLPLLNSALVEVEPGSMEELIWNGVAGPDGWGMKILSGYPKPVLLSDYKWPVDIDRYIPIVKNEVGGFFIDKNSIEIAVDGCTALAVQAFNYDGEMQMGGMIMQYTLQPYEDAIYAISNYDYSFSKKVMRQTHFTVFGPEDKIIYSVKLANPIWEDVDMNPMTMPSLGLISENLPEKLYEALSADVKEFVSYARKRYEELREMFPPEEEESPEL
jgi:hypothetical protein